MRIPCHAEKKCRRKVLFNGCRAHQIRRTLVEVDRFSVGPVPVPNAPDLGPRIVKTFIPAPPEVNQFSNFRKSLSLAGTKDIVGANGRRCAHDLVQQGRATIRRAQDKQMGGRNRPTDEVFNLPSATQSTAFRIENTFRQGHTFRSKSLTHFSDPPRTCHQYFRFCHVISFYCSFRQNAYFPLHQLEGEDRRPSVSNRPKKP